MEFIDVCRVCLKNSRQYIDLDTPFEQDDTVNGEKEEYGETQSQPFTYMDCFRMCTRLEIVGDYDDINGVSVPQSLCDTCAIELRITYDFLQKARRAHAMLQEAMLETNVEINENEWETDYESAYQVSEDDYKVEQSCISDDQPENTQERLLNTQQTENESDIVTEDIPSTTTLDPLTLLKIPNKKVVGPRTINNVKYNVIKRTTETNRRCDPTKSTSKDKVIKTISTKPERRGSLNKEMLKQKSIQKRIFLCHACPLIYKDAHKFRQHTLAHEGKRERKLTCLQCGKKFFNQTALQLHVKVHENNRQPTYHCDQCDKSYFHSGSLYLHKQYHSEKRIDCKICGKLYVRQIDLDVHSRSHSGDLPYKCNKCDKAFAQMGHLTKHLENHDGYRYKCDLCGKEYKAQTTLYQHYRKHTGMPFKCSICDVGFITNYKIRRHISGVHKLENAEEVGQFIIKVKTKKEYLWQKKASFLTINKNVN